MPVGTEVEIGEIYGKFVLPQDEGQALVFIAGGIGITPFISKLRYIKNSNLNYNISLKPLVNICLKIF